MLLSMLEYDTKSSFQLFYFNVFTHNDERNYFISENYMIVCKEIKATLIFHEKEVILKL